MSRDPVAVAVVMTSDCMTVTPVAGYPAAITIMMAGHPVSSAIPNGSVNRRRGAVGRIQSVMESTDCKNARRGRGNSPVGECSSLDNVRKKNSEKHKNKTYYNVPCFHLFIFPL